MTCKFSDFSDPTQKKIKTTDLWFNEFTGWQSMQTRSAMHTAICTPYHGYIIQQPSLDIHNVHA